MVLGVGYRLTNIILENDLKNYFLIQTIIRDARCLKSRIPNEYKSVSAAYNMLSCASSRS